MLPVGILMAFTAMRLLGLGSNIMSLGGIAIAIGAMIDAAIVMIENTHKHLERAAPGHARIDILIRSMQQVGGRYSLDNWADGLALRSCPNCGTYSPDLGME
jgi:Cu(I)/Ag(I) efflux system membrane protein CusA/SilA